MPTLRQSAQVAAKLPVISACGYEPIVIVGDYVTVAGIVINDVIEMGILPAGYVPVDAILICEDMDSVTGLTLDLGLISGTAGAADNARTGGNEALAASTIGQTGGIVGPAKAAWGFIAPTDADRGIGIKIAAAATTPIIGAKVRLTVIARPALNGV